LLLLYRKKKKLPTKLDLSSFKKRKDGKSLGGLRKVQAEIVDERSEDFSANDVFVYRGQKYNAWQVLNVPVGANEFEIKRAFAKKTKIDSVNKELYFKALKSIV